ncbi:ribosomal protein S8 [Crepidotus variabilis]|uniref:Ribosomal protein S8 n=1 Tax=Crepidotus variabilis TaxID=179855 RepID=A0A9P6E586_9AGAR|nr:ribosomal protein S8 [Crepidotus variabilis]
MLPHDICSKIQNSFRARHAMVSLTHNTQTLGVLNILLRAGFLSSITRGTVAGPSPDQFGSAEESQKRIWATLKYRDDMPVLSNMELISKPSRRIFLDLKDIRLICSGRRSGDGLVKPLGMGEVAMVRTRDKEHEWLEAREALVMKIPGEAVCRAR